jgi:hypothetical protein
MARVAAEWLGGVELEVAGDNGEKRVGGRGGWGKVPIYKGWVPSVRNKESMPIVSPI